MRNWWRDHAWWFVVGGGTVAVLGALTAVLTRPTFPLETGDQRASVVGATMAVLSFPVSLASLWVAVRQQRRDRQPAIEEHLDSLARAVERQWTREGAARGLSRPDPLRVRWSTTTRPVAPAPGDVVPTVPGRVTRLKLEGDVTGIAASFRQLPRGQIVVIGAPGSGKTSLAVLLARDLVRGRAKFEPVPVLFNRSSPISRGRSTPRRALILGDSVVSPVASSRRIGSRSAAHWRVRRGLHLVGQGI